jgi:hypothetical protein
VSDEAEAAQLAGGGGGDAALPDLAAVQDACEQLMARLNHQVMETLPDGDTPVDTVSSYEMAPLLQVRQGFVGQGARGGSSAISRSHIILLEWMGHVGQTGKGPRLTS